MKIDSIKHISGCGTAFFVATAILMATMNTCSSRSMKPPQMAGFEVVLTRPREHPLNASIPNERSPPQPPRQAHSRIFKPQRIETKNFEKPKTIQPLLGKSIQMAPLTYCQLANSVGSSDGSNTAISSSQTSSGGGSASLASSTSSSSSSSSSTSSSSSSSSSFASSSNTQSSSANANQNQALASSASSSLSGIHSSIDNSLPTNGDYYSLAASESQSYNDLHSTNQYDKNKESTSSADIFSTDHHKKAWAEFMKLPSHMVQKWKKFHADFTGKGPLYGTDYFAHES